MILIFVARLDLSTQPISISIYKANGFTLKTYNIVMTGFFIWDKYGIIRFFEETFLFTDTSIEVVLGISFLTLSSMDV